MSRLSIFCRFFLSPSAEKFRRETFSVSLISGTEKVWIRGGGEYQDFPSKAFCLIVPKTSVGESFTVATISGFEKVWIRRGEYHHFPSKFLSHCTKKFHWRTLWCFRKNHLSKDFMQRRGHHGFVGTFCLTGPKRKLLYRNLSVSGNFLVSKKIYG